MNEAQPCVNCGRSTAPGSTMFAGRGVIPARSGGGDAGTAYLCSECSEEIHAAAREAY